MKFLVVNCCKNVLKSANHLLDGLFESNLLVFDETRFLEVLLTFLLLLRLEVSGVSGVKTLRVGVMALNLLVVFSLFNSDNLG